MNTRKIYILIALLVITLGLHAQEKVTYHKNEFSTYLGGGLSTLQYNMSVGERSGGFGGILGIGYTYRFTDKWGLQAGLEIGLYNAKATIASLEEYYETDVVDNLGNRVSVDALTSNYDEKQKATLLQIPLMLQYTPISLITVGIGAKLAIPLSASYDCVGDLQASGYNPYTGNSYTNMTARGFGDYNGVTGDGDTFGIGCMLSAEAGLNWPLGKGHLYTGLYVDYGVTNMLKGEPSSNFTEMLDNGSYVYNSVLNGYYTNNDGQHDFTDKMMPFAVGVKIRFNIGW